MPVFVFIDESEKSAFAQFTLHGLVSPLNSGSLFTSCFTPFIHISGTRPAFMHFIQ